jgi:hypothetical protein
VVRYRQREGVTEDIRRSGIAAFNLSAQGSPKRRKTPKLYFIKQFKSNIFKNGKPQIIGEENSPGQEKGSAQQVLCQDHA